MDDSREEKSLPQQELPVSKNIFQLEGLIAEKKIDLMAKIDALDSISVLHDPEDIQEQLERAKNTAKQLIDKLPEKQKAIESLIRKYTIDIPLDSVFVDELLFLTERHLQTPENQRDQLFYQQEQEVVQNALNSLRYRKAIEKHERGKEEEFDIEISGGRTFKFFVSENADRIRMELPLVKDPNREQVEIGPTAVVDILGQKLSLDDYKKIAETTLSFKGKAGQICRAYAQAIEIWAELYTEGKEAENALFVRKMRAHDVRKAFGGEDPRIGPFTDIPLNAIFTHVRSRYPSINQSTVPQPFES